MKDKIIVSFLLISLLTFLCRCEKMEMNDTGNLVPLTVVDDASLPSYTLSDDTKLHLETFGDDTNPVLIVLHGGPGDSYQPYLNFKPLSDDYFMVFWDQRGAGLSERVPNNELTGEQYLKDLHELVTHFSPNNKVHLIGHSFGGSFATYYVQNYPEKVDKLVLLEPGSLNKEAAENTTSASVAFFDKEFQAFLNHSDYLAPNNDGKADYFRMTMQFEEQTEGWFDTRSGYRCNYYINEWQGMWDASYTFDFTSGLENFTNEILFIVGTTERLGKEYQEAYHTKYFNLYEGKTFTLEGADHFQLVLGDETVSKIREYFNN